MSNLQHRPWAPPAERGRFWLLASVRDLVDRIAAGSPARLAVFSFAATGSISSSENRPTTAAKENTANRAGEPAAMR